MRRLLVLLLASLPAFLPAPAVGKEDGPAKQAPEPAIGPPVSIEWRLAPSDFVRFERRKVTRKEDREVLGRESVETVHGHDLREGQYLPSGAARGDLPMVLAFRLSPADATSERVKIDIRLAKVASIRLKGKVEAREYGPDAALVTAEYEFASKGRPAKSDTHRIHGGKAVVRTVFDRKEGVVRSSRIAISYGYRRIDAKPAEKSTMVRTEFDFAPMDLKRVGYAGFQPDVDAAIERGVARLRSLAREDGTFKPHGNWDFGTTALAVFTLVSCDVPRTDPKIESALAWLCSQSPERTYELSLGLMAVERAYTPQWEVLRERRGEPVTFKRELPADRRAWCEEIAEALEKNARSPGIWGYPQANPRVTLQFDTSNTQYAVLGLRAAARLGIEVKEATWLGVVRYLQQVREKDGPRGAVVLLPEGEPADSTIAETLVSSAAGFRYSTIAAYPKAWGSMTCAGIASLAIARDQLARVKSRRLDAKMTRAIDEMSAGAWAWLDRNWAVDRHPGHPGNSWYYYWLYSLERAGVLTRVKRVGGKDWYFEGAVQLLARQKKKGQWSAPGKGDIPETCFALLFLKRATAPLTSGR